MDDLPQDLDDLKEWYGEHVVGRLESGWPYIRQAAASSYFQSVRALSELSGSWSKSQERRESRPGEALFILELGYRVQASGPLLSAVLLPTFALEAFLSMSASAAFAAHGQSGTPLALALHGFDSQSFDQRVDLVLELAEAEPCPNGRRQAIRHLIQFRNSVAHDTPVLNAPGGRQLRAKRGRVKPVDPSPDTPYPDLRAAVMPLDLGHAQSAVRSHDQFVDHVLETSSAEFQQGFSDVASLTDQGSRRIDGFGSKWWTEGEKVHQFWTASVIRWVESVALDDYTDFLMALRRRSSVRLHGEQEGEEEETS